VAACTKPTTGVQVIGAPWAAAAASTRLPSQAALGSCRQHDAPICSMPDLLLLLGGELLVGGVLPQARRHTPRLGVCPPAHMAHRGY
jgi:hypothetical protein